MNDWKTNPKAHRFQPDPAPDEIAQAMGIREVPWICEWCGEAPDAHNGSEIPTDQVLWQMPPDLAPRLFGEDL